MANNPVFFTSFVANSEIMLSIFVQTFGLSSSPAAMALAILVLDIARTAFVVAFMGLLVFGNMTLNEQPNNKCKRDKKSLDHVRRPC